jgi:hypothetical protein
VRADSTSAHGCVQCSVKRGELARAITWDTVGTVLRADQHCGVLVELLVIALIHRFLKPFLAIAADLWCVTNPRVPYEIGPPLFETAFRKSSGRFTALQQGYSQPFHRLKVSQN